MNKRARGRPRLPEPPYELFSPQICHDYYRLRAGIDDEAKQVAAQRTETNQAFRERGLDPEAMNYVIRLRAKVESGRLTRQDAQARVDRLSTYADWLLGQQADMFRESAAA